MSLRKEIMSKTLDFSSLSCYNMSKYPHEGSFKGENHHGRKRGCAKNAPTKGFRGE